MNIMDIEEYFTYRRIVPWRMQEMREQLGADEDNLKALLSKNLQFQEKDTWDKLEEALSWVKCDRKELAKMSSEDGVEIFSFKETDSLIMEAEELLKRKINFLVSNGRD